MQNSKLIVFLRTLSDAEMKDLGKYIEYKTASYATDIKNLYQYLKKHHPNYTFTEESKSEIVKKIFPKENLRKLENVMTRFNRILEDFLIQKEFEESKIEKDFFLLQALKKRKLNDYFFRKTEQLENDWQKQKVEGLEDLHNLYKLKKIHFMHPNYNDIKKIANISKTLSYHLDEYYSATKLYWTLNNYINSSHLNNDESAKNSIYSIQNTIAYALNADLKHPPSITLLGEITQAFYTQNFAVYPKLKEIFYKHIDDFNKYEQTDLVDYLTNICYTNYKLGKKEALKDLFELKRFSVEQGFLLEDGYISNFSFQNIVNIACTAQELDWAEKFVKKYASFIEAEKRQDNDRLCKAIIYLHRKKHEEVLEILAPLRFQNVYYGVQARALLLQTYYQLDQSFDNLVNNFKVFLYRDVKLAETLKKSFKNFIKFTNKLYKAKTTYKADLTSLEKNINSCTQIVYKSWLLEKLEELQNKLL